MDKLSEKQVVNLINKEQLSINHVLNVDSFSDDFLEISTKDGQMCVEGASLKIEELRQDEGIIHIKGSINAIYYKAEKVKSKFLGGIFG